MPSTTFDEIIVRLLEATGSKRKMELCQFLGVGTEAIRSAKQRGKIPSSWFIDVSERTGYTVEWLRNGTGQKLKVAQDPPASPSGISVQEDLNIAAKVLVSNTPYSVALHLNIHQFGKAVDEQSRIEDQEVVIQQLQQESSFMKKEVEELKSQLARLLATGGDVLPDKEIA